MSALVLPASVTGRVRARLVGSSLFRCDRVDPGVTVSDGLGVT